MSKSPCCYEISCRIRPDHTFSVENQLNSGTRAFILATFLGSRKLWMCQMFRVIPWRWFGFLNRNHRSTIILSTTNFHSAMIGLKSTVQSASLPAQLVIVEGNIGVGKSTLACQLARKLNYRVFLEPTTKNPYLAKFYQDPKKYALKLQLWIFKQRFRTYIEATKHVLNSGK